MGKHCLGGDNKEEGSMQIHHHRHVILASGSPRRQRYLDQFNFNFDIIVPSITEAMADDEYPLDYVRRMAVEKGEAVLSQCPPDALVISADTIVVLDGQVLGKPADPAHAREMLSRLSGRTHAVITAYMLLDRPTESRIIHHAVTEVTFKSLSSSLIDAYIRSQEPYDKAGSYSLQETATLFVASVHGSYNNVVGLPIELVMNDMMDQGWVEIG